MEKFAEVLWREKMEMHPDEDDDGQEGEDANDDARGALGSVGVCEGLLDEGDFGAGIFGIGLLVIRAHAGFLSEMRCLRRVETP